jgi:hypothetical protein
LVVLETRFDLQIGGRPDDPSAGVVNPGVGALDGLM